MKRKLFFISLISYFFLVFTNSETIAQVDSAEINYLDMPLEELLNLEVVTASKKMEKLSEVPATVYVITEEQIKIRGYTNLEEVLEDIPEIEIQKKTSVEYSNWFTLRGIDGNEKFIILMDGMRINSPAGTPLAIVNNYPVANAKQIEVILGPASALYGVDAFTGVINIITKKGIEAKGVNFYTSYGTYNTTDNSLVVGAGNEDISFIVSAKYYYTDEPDFQNIFKDEYAWYHDQYKTNGKVLLSPWSNDTITLPKIYDYETPTNSYAFSAKINFKDFEAGYFRNYESHSSSFSTRPEYTIYADETSFKFIVESWYTSHHYETNNKKWLFQTTLSHCLDEVDPKSLYINTYTSYNKGYKYAFNRDLKIEELITHNFSERMSLIAGFSYEDITALAKSGDLPFPFDRDLAADIQGQYYLGTNIKDSAGNDLAIYQDFYYLQYQNLGAFLQFHTHFADKFAITLGGRYDHNTRYEATINPRLGLVYAPINKLRVKLLFGQAYLAPSPYRTYQHYGSFIPLTDTVTGDTIGLTSNFWRLPGTDVEAQKITTVEASISYFITENIALSANGFFNDIDNLLSSTGFAGEEFHGIPVVNIQRPINKGNAMTYGGTVRLNMKWKLSSINLNSYFGYSFVDGEIDGQALQFAAKNTAKGGLDINYKEFSCSPRILFRSKSFHPSLKDDDGNPIYTEPYSLINFTARYNVSNSTKSKLDLFIKISNLLNNKYYNLPKGGDECFLYVPQDPIRVNFGLNVLLL